ncbi:protein DUF218 [Candidatus Termititenax spirochaetophilus]|uniref:Protein DUF218 n=1 Tax=Candidatus Termititenax spirochaetophilus TaxID=2218522 RepID=A0A388T8J4_9BACT|nr:protein DUF218 [Candidatus Termititenax spirochaetophilus]
MFLLGKIFTWSILSPGVFLIILLLLITAIISDRRRISIFFLVLVCCSMYFLSVKPGRDKIIQPLETKYKQPQKPNVDVLIVLGGGVSKSGAPEDATLQRLYYAYQIYKQNPVPLIVCGGDPLGSGIRESAVMSRVLESWGVPQDKIYQENQSRNTAENLRNARTYLQKYKFKKPGLVTSAMHLPRAVQIAKSLGITSVPLPCAFKYEGELYQWYDVFPNAGYLQDSFSGLKEYTGQFYYRLGSASKIKR